METSKGTATSQLIDEYGLHGGIYLGDDITDISAFRAIQTASQNQGFQGVAIGIINPEAPKELAEEADFTLNEVSDAERFLQWMSQPLPPAPI